MIITSFKKSKRGNILIYADKKYFASIPDEVFIKQGFKIGGYIDEKILSAVLTDINNYKAKERALNLLSFRAHSKKELEQKLKQKSFDESSAKQAVEKMSELGLLNDFEFAKSLANELIFRKFYSGSRVKYELSKKGIDKNIIDDILEEIDFDEYEIAKKFIQKKCRNVVNLDEKIKKRLVGSLQRLGYSWGAIKYAVDIEKDC